MRIKPRTTFTFLLYSLFFIQPAIPHGGHEKHDIDGSILWDYNKKSNTSSESAHSHSHESIEATTVNGETTPAENGDVHGNVHYIAPTDEVHEFEVEKINKVLKDHPTLTEKDVEHDNDYYLEAYLADLTEEDLEEEYEELIQEEPEVTLDHKIEQWVLANKKRPYVKVFNVKVGTQGVASIDPGAYNSNQLNRWKPSFLKNYNYQIRPYYRISQNTMKESISGVLVRFKGSSLFGLGIEAELNRHYKNNPLKDFSFTFGAEFVKVLSSAQNDLPISSAFWGHFGKSFFDPWLYIYGGITQQQISSDTELNDLVKTRTTDITWAEIGTKYTVNLINNRRMVFFASYSNAVVADSDKAGSRQDSLTGNRFRMQARTDWKKKYWFRIGLDSIALEGATNLDFTTPEMMFGIYF